MNGVCEFRAGVSGVGGSSAKGAVGKNWQCGKWVLEVTDPYTLDLNAAVEAE